MMAPIVQKAALGLALILPGFQPLRARAADFPSPTVLDPDQDLSDIARYLTALPGATKRVVIVNESGVLLDDIPMPSASLRFLTDDTPSIQYLTPERIGEIEPLFDHTYIVTTQPPSAELETSLRAEFPSLKKEPGTITVFRL